MRLFLFFLLLTQTAHAALFSDDERARLVAFWNAPGRYSIGARADATTSGPWVVRLTPEASLWFSAYARAARTAPPPAEWENWVKAKVAFDTFAAQAAADASNAQSGVAMPLPPVANPPAPGPMPRALFDAVGNPPPFAASVAPRRYVVTFDDGAVISYTDQTKMPARSPYFRFAQGVMYSGTTLKNVPDADLDSLFAEAGLTPFEVRVAKAVSRLEGGFESVNTYDTGYLSVGFIQFATLSGGAGSLGAVLKQQKNTRPAEFENDFRRYGIDVDDKGALVAIDPATGAELAALPAVLKIIDDKRLTAVFQRAGTLSRAFRVAQIQIAKAQYYPADAPLSITVGNAVFKGKLSDVIKSEAGMATMMDRKVNTGNLSPLTDVLTRILTAHNAATLADAALYEREIVQAMKFRADFLSDKTLTQPQ